MDDCKDESYYYSFVVFKVEGCLFRVPQHGFESQSEVFKTMFALPSGEDTDQDGCSGDRPLLLEGVKADDFRAFLKLLYPRPTQADEIILSEEESLVVLTMARMWCFDKIVKITIEGLEAMGLPSARKLEIARHHNIMHWYEPELSALVFRENSLTLDEGRQVGLDLMVELSAVRDWKYRSIKLSQDEYRLSTMERYIKRKLNEIVEQIKDNLE